MSCSVPKVWVEWPQRCLSVCLVRIMSRVIPIPHPRPLTTTYLVIPLASVTRKLVSRTFYLNYTTHYRPSLVNSVLRVPPCCVCCHPWVKPSGPVLVVCKVAQFSCLSLHRTVIIFCKSNKFPQVQIVFLRSVPLFCSTSAWCEP